MVVTTFFITPSYIMLSACERKIIKSPQQIQVYLEQLIVNKMDWGGFVHCRYIVYDISELNKGRAAQDSCYLYTVCLKA